MSVGRNDPYPCGSGKKHRKWCLAKDEAAARAKAVADAQAAEAARQAEQAAQQAQQKQATREWEERRQNEPPLDDDDVATEPKVIREPDWPPLPAEDQRFVDAWWEEVGPVYTGKGGKEKCGWLLERTLGFLDHYLAQRCRDFFCLKGVRPLSTLQAFHYFTEYLVAYGCFSAADAGALQSAVVDFYETIRGAVDPSDPAYHICPTYEALIAGPVASVPAPH
jgi:hypothetical protein